MKYTTVSECLVLLPMINSAGVSSAELTGFGDRAEAVMEAKLARLYTIPVTGSGVPPLLQTIATIKTLHDLLTQRLFTQAKLKESSWPAQFKYADEMLDQIAKGEILLVSSAGTVIAARTDMAQLRTTTEGYVPTFTELDPFENSIDPDKTEDLRDDKDFWGSQIDA